MMKKMMKKFLSLALAAALALPMAMPVSAHEESPFGDVPATHWAYGAICRASADGVIVGTGAQTETGLPRFEPDADLTSAQFAAIVTGAFSQTIPEVAGPWYAPFQKAMEDAGWDMGAGIQDWEVPMTRYQMAAVLYNIVKDKGLESSAASFAIADLDQIPAEYQEAVKAVYALELLSGMDEQGSFAGDQTLTRAQAAVVYGKLKDALAASGVLMEQVLEEQEQQLKNAGLRYEFTRHPGKNGTVYVAYQFGTSHGTACAMEYVARDGGRLDILELLPDYSAYGAAYYAHPTEIQFDETGETLHFITPVQESKGGTEEVTFWGDTRCTVDLVSGTMVSMEPLTPFDLAEWKVIYEPDRPLTPASQLSMTVKNDSLNKIARPYVQDGGFPFAGMFVIADQEGITVAHPVALLSDADFLSSAYGKAVKALEGLSVPVGEDTAERREQAGWYFQVEHNGQPVPGTFFSRYINLDYKDLEQLPSGQYTCMRLQFDQPVTLNAGDTLTVRVGPASGR